jgi:hypothetical protein
VISPVGLAIQPICAQFPKIAISIKLSDRSVRDELGGRYLCPRDYIGPLDQLDQQPLLVTSPRGICRE